MSDFVCPNVNNCPGTDDPVGNLSAEGYDPFIYSHIVYPPDRRGGSQWRGACCQQVCTSTVSQEAADLCAENLAVLAAQGGCGLVTHADGSVSCADGNDPPNTCDPSLYTCDETCTDCNPSTSVYWNDAQTVNKRCGTTNFYFYHTVAANKYSATSKILANRIALNRAYYELNRQKFCLTPTQLIFCKDVLGTDYLRLTGSGLGPYLWTITGLPTGIVATPANVLGSVVMLSGIPTVSGVSTVSISVQDARGNTLVGTIQIGVTAVTPATLPEAQLGVLYDVDLAVTGLPTGMTATFSVTSGALPTGVVLFEEGTIYGTPTGGLPATFTIGWTAT